jgi:glycosyltransferase involved in cell wall biosynthesis
MDLPDDVEILLIDDGSDPAITDTVGVKNLRIIFTNDKRPWTWALARNRGAKEARGDYFLMCDLDYIIPKEAIMSALEFNGAKMRFKRQFGILDENGKFSQDRQTLMNYGLSAKRIDDRGFDLPPHPNNFVMRKDVYWDLGGYREDLFMKPYPQGEDGLFKREWVKAVEKGKYVDSDYRPMLYMFPNGQFCGDVDYNPFNLFHDLSRRTNVNPFISKETKKQTLSVVIPARNEEFLERTINNVLDNSEYDTEVIAILDGCWCNPPLKDRSKVTLIHHTDPVGQRAGVNEGCRLSKSKYVMKLDAHCIVDKGFDRKLIEPYENGEIGMDTTTIPRMYNLHAFDWLCKDCGNRKYQSPTPSECEKCHSKNVVRDIVWKPRFNRMTECWMFDKDMHFQYWNEGRRRKEALGELVDVMSSVGACFFMPRERFFAIDGLDEKHGSWGQFGTEIACKSWLSGGRHIVNKRTWFSHLFRTQGGDFGFPYQINGNDQERAKQYSRDLWLNDKWEKAVKPLSWLVDKFSPVPTWNK